MVEPVGVRAELWAWFALALGHCVYRGEFERFDDLHVVLHSRAFVARWACIPSLSDRMLIYLCYRWRDQWEQDRTPWNNSRPAYRRSLGLYPLLSLPQPTPTDLVYPNQRPSHPPTRVRLLLPSRHPFLRQRSHRKPSHLCDIQPRRLVRGELVAQVDARKRALDVEREEDEQEHGE